MKYDIDFLREILALLIEHHESTADLTIFDRTGFAKGLEDQKELDRLFYHLKILQDHNAFEVINGGKNNPNNFGFLDKNYGEWTFSIGPRFRVTAKGHEFYEQTCDKTIWEKSKKAAQKYGFSFVVEVAKEYAKKALLPG